MLWQNLGKVANNARNDDGNGRVNALLGWDVSDQDEDVQPTVQDSLSIHTALIWRH